MAASSVKGILLDSSGKPVENAIIMIVDGTSEFNDMASVTNEKGEFYLSNIQLPGTYKLEVRNNDQKTVETLSLDTKDTLINIHL